MAGLRSASSHKGPEEIRVARDLGDVLLGVAGAKQLEAGNPAGLVHRDQHIARPGVANDLVRVRGRGEEQTEGVAVRVDNVVQPASWVAELNARGGRKEFARGANRNARAALRIKPARLGMNQGRDGHEHADAVEAQEVGQVEETRHGNQARVAINEDDDLGCPSEPAELPTAPHKIISPAAPGRNRYARCHRRLGWKTSRLPCGRC